MNPSKVASPHQWLVWRANGAVHLHGNPAIDKTLRRFAKAKLQGVKGSERFPDHIVPAQTGDLVIHVPADGSRGHGPLYVDSGDNWGYGGDSTQVAVSVLSNGMSAWTYGLPRDEVVVVGHIDIARFERYGNAFALEALKRAQVAIEAGKSQFFDWFPTFSDGRAEAPLSEVLAWSIRSAYVADGTAVGLTPGDWENPGTIPNQTAYAVPRDGYRTYVEATAHPGKYMIVPTDDSGRRRVHYVLIRG